MGEVGDSPAGIDERLGKRILKRGWSWVGPKGMSGKSNGGVEQQVEIHARGAVSSPATKKEELCKRMRRGKGRPRGQMLHDGTIEASQRCEANRAAACAAVLVI